MDCPRRGAGSQVEGRPLPQGQGAEEEKGFVRTGAHRFFFIEGGTRPCTPASRSGRRGCRGPRECVPCRSQATCSGLRRHAISSPPIAAPGRFRFFRFLRKSCAFEQGDNPRVGRPWVRQGQIERFVGYVESQSSSVGVIARRAPLLFPKRDS